MISIIIPTAFEGGKYLSILLPILSKEKGVEIIVVDNASHDDTETICSKFQLNYIKNKSNLGFAKACNIGANLAKGQYLLFLNNDTYPQVGFSQIMREVMANPKYWNNAEMGIVGVKMVYLKNGKLQHVGVSFTPQGYAYELREVDLDYEREVNAVTAACMLIRKEVFKRVGGFDEVYINGWEDNDLCLKVRELGYRIVYTNKTYVKHVHMGSPTRLDKESENQRIFKSRWIDTGKVFKITGIK